VLKKWRKGRRKMTLKDYGLPFPLLLRNSNMKLYIYIYIYMHISGRKPISRYEASFLYSFSSSCFFPFRLLNEKAKAVVFHENWNMRADHLPVPSPLRKPQRLATTKSGEEV
ncbi:hypothetical protein Pfo_000064, partial [Paulownia fortunei]